VGERLHDQKGKILFATATQRIFLHFLSSQSRGNWIPFDQNLGCGRVRRVKVCFHKLKGKTINTNI